MSDHTPDGAEDALFREWELDDLLIAHRQNKCGGELDGCVWCAYDAAKEGE